MNIAAMQVSIVGQWRISVGKARNQSQEPLNRKFNLLNKEIPTQA